MLEFYSGHIMNLRKRELNYQFADVFTHVFTCQYNFQNVSYFVTLFLAKYP